MFLLCYSSHNVFTYFRLPGLGCRSCAIFVYIADFYWDITLFLLFFLWYGKGGYKPPGNHKWTQISSGYMHNCGVTGTGDAICWGQDTGKQATVPDGFVPAV